MEFSLEHYLDKLKEKGFKITPRRKAIIEIFMRSSKHLTPEEVWNQLQNQFYHCGLPGVYRNLEALAECGILTRIQHLDRKKHYVLCNGCASSFEQHHHHITCVKCGKVEEIKDCPIENRLKINGYYKVVSHFIQVNGVCAGCLDR